MTPPIGLTFQNLTRLANTLDDSTSIVVKNGGFETRGKVGAFFTLKSTNRHAGNVLFSAVRQMYGDTVANALAPQMRASRDEGKPLSARVVRDVLASAAEMHQSIPRINDDMVRHFLTGNAAPGDTRNLDTAFATFCASKNIDPAANQQLKNAFADAVRQFASGETSRILSYAELSELVVTANTMAMQKAWNEVQAKAFVDDAVNGAAAATDACAASQGIPDQYKQELGRLVTLIASYEGAMAAEKGVPFDARALFQEIATGRRPEIQAFAFACSNEKRTVSDVTAESISRAPFDKLADCAMLTSQLDNAGVSCQLLVMQHLDTLRTLQPTGLLTRENIWQVCFNEPCPDQVKDGTERDFNNAMFTRLGDVFRQALPNNIGAGEIGMMTLATGITLAKSIESMHGPISLSMEDFVNVPSLTPLPRLGTLQEVEASIAKDIQRRGSDGYLPDYTPIISFTASGGTTQTVHIQDTTGMTKEEKAAFEGGFPSSISASLVRHALELCSGNELQARQVIQSMGQGGAFLVRTSSPVTGIIRTEHSPLDIDIRREDNGNVTMRFYTPASSPLDLDYTYTITPDGHGRMTACRIQARNTDQPAAAEE